MSIEIVKVNGTHHIVDKSHPGWKTLAVHASIERAEAELKRLTAKPKKGRGQKKADTPTTETPDQDAPLRAILSGTVREIRDALTSLDGPALERLSALETLGAGRSTVLDAIAKRIG